MTRLVFLAVFTAAMFAAAGQIAFAQSGQVAAPDYEPVPPQQLSARMIGEFDAPEARQGVAVDGHHFYAVINTVIGKYDKETGENVGRWMSPRGGLIGHINSCFAEDGRLWCANSNYPETPMASSVEVFDSGEMRHIESHSLGILDEGSLTFFDRYGDGWIAGFAHYDEDGGLEYKDSSFSGIVAFDTDWRRTGGWMLPQSVRERMAPHAASGGAFGPDGLLYLFGHDQPEMYVLARPAMGPVLLHVATIEIDAAGQAFAWDKSQPRTIYAINRPTSSVRVFEMPEVQLRDPDARRFSEAP